MSDSNPIRLERVSFADLDARLWPVWEELLRQDEDGSPFLSPEWIGAWLGVYGETSRASAMIWWAGHEPVGAVLLTHGKGKVGPFNIDRAFLNASTDSTVWCEQNGMLHVNGHAAAMVRDMSAYVASERIDELVLRGVRPDALARLRESWGPHTIEGFASPAPYVDLDSLRVAGVDYLSCLSGNTRWQIRRSTRIYEELYGAPSVEEASDPERLRPAFEELVELHQSQWSRRGEGGALKDPDVLRFHRELMRTDDGSDHSLRPTILTIRFGSTVVGQLYNLVWRGREYSLQSGFRIEDDPRLKPGLVSHSVAIQRGLDRGSRAYELLGGHPHHVRYKQSLSTGFRTNYWVEVQSRGFRMGLIRRLRLTKRYFSGQRERANDPLLENR